MYIWHRGFSDTTDFSKTTAEKPAVQHTTAESGVASLG
jgi:hypothetical protein